MISLHIPSLCVAKHAVCSECLHLTVEYQTLEELVIATVRSPLAVISPLSTPFIVYLDS